MNFRGEKWPAPTEESCQIGTNELSEEEKMASLAIP